MPVPARLLLVALLLLTQFPAVHLQAATLRVPSEYATIQAALDASNRGDEVLVAPGNYSARSTKTLTGPPINGLTNPVTALAFIPSGVALRSETGAAQTILDGVDSGVRGVIIHGGKARDAAAGAGKSLPDGNVLPTPGPATLEGFSIANTSIAITVGNVRFAILNNSVGAKIEIWESTTAGLVEGNTQTGGVICYATSVDGTIWQNNVFPAGPGNIICRCNRSIWTGNTINKGLSLWPYESTASVSVIDNEFTGGGISGTSADFYIAGNTMTGLGGGTGILVALGARGVIENNTLMAYTDGMAIGGPFEVRYNSLDGCRDGFDGLSSQAFLHHNTITNSLNWGIAAYSTAATIEDNIILGSGYEGVFIPNAGGALRRNVILYSGREGIYQPFGIIEGNTVAFGKSDGVHLEAGILRPPPGVIGPVVTGNTIVGNAAHGLVAGNLSDDNSIDHNIVAFNGGDGIHCLAGIPPVNVSCNDSYSNQGQPFAGFCGNAAGNNGNISLDPLFCNYEAQDFTLMAGSPCASDNPTGCGLMGAYPVACATPQQKAASTQTTSWGHLKSLFRQ